MVTTQKRLRRTAINLSVAAFAFASLGAAVAAAPFVVGTTVARTDIGALTPLATGPAIQLAKAKGGAAEDCVRVTRMTGPDGKEYPTNSLVCSGE